MRPFPEDEALCEVLTVPLRYSSRSTDEGTEAAGGEVACPGLHRGPAVVWLPLPLSPRVPHLS